MASINRSIITSAHQGQCHFCTNEYINKSDIRNEDEPIRKILIVIDVQNDFIDAALGTKEALDDAIDIMEDTLDEIE